MKSVGKDSTGYLNNTSKNKLLGHFSGKVDYHNNDRHSENNLWIKGEVDSNGFFTLTSLAAKKNLRATSKTKFDLVEQGALFVMLYNLSLKLMFFPFFHLYRS